VTAPRTAEWFKSKGIAKLWFLLFFSLCFGIVTTTLSQLAVFFVGRFVFQEEYGAFRLASVLPQLVILIGFGTYLANQAWKSARIAQLDQNA
jgi:hypothetical protein